MAVALVHGGQRLTGQRSQTWSFSRIHGFRSREEMERGSDTEERIKKVHKTVIHRARKGGGEYGAGGSWGIASAWVRNWPVHSKSRSYR